MIRYKRGVNNITELKNSNFLISNNKDTYLYMKSNLELNAPFQGLYINDNKVILSNVVEKIEVGNKEYRNISITNNFKNICADEYILDVDLEKYEFEYLIDNVIFKKKFNYIDSENIFVIDYEIKNNSKSKIKFDVIPLLTYRNIFETKSFDKLKFNQRDTDYGQVISLSVINQENFVIKSKDLRFLKKQEYIKNIKYEYIDKTEDKVILHDDLYIPGMLETVLKPSEEKNVRVIFSSKDVDINLIEDNFVTNKYEEIKKNICEEYVELKDLVQSVESLSFENSYIDEIPYIKKEKIDVLLNLIKSVEGKYLVLDRVKEAKVNTIKIKKEFDTLDMPTSIEEIKNRFKFKLWYIETVGKILQKSINENDVDTFILEIKKIIDEIISIENIQDNELIDIESICLVYNALKIYEDILAKKKLDYYIINKHSEIIKKIIEENFWDEERRLLKYIPNEEKSIARVEMIYAISLSYPCVTTDIQVKLLDTIFKELYTPYGLREYAKNKLDESSYIYPKYMAHFVKANLRQNGVTRASQKISYNLVKELLLDINKTLNGGVKKVYHDKGKKVENNTYDIYTNSEMIRLYDMLT